MVPAWIFDPGHALFRFLTTLSEPQRLAVFQPADHLIPVTLFMPNLFCHEFCYSLHAPCNTLSATPCVGMVTQERESWSNLASRDSNRYHEMLSVVVKIISWPGHADDLGLRPRNCAGFQLAPTLPKISLSFAGPIIRTLIYEDDATLG